MRKISRGYGKAPPTPPSRSHVYPPPLWWKEVKSSRATALLSFAKLSCVRLIAQWNLAPGILLKITCTMVGWFQLRSISLVLILSVRIVVEWNHFLLNCFKTVDLIRLRNTTKYTNHCCKVSIASHHMHLFLNITTLTTTALLPSCFLSTQEVAYACGVRGGACEVVSGKGEGAGGHSLPLRQPGARGLDRDRWPHPGHKRANIGRAEEGGVGGAGPTVDTHNHTHTHTPALISTHCIMLVCILQYLCSSLNIWAILLKLNKCITIYFVNVFFYYLIIRNLLIKKNIKKWLCCVLSDPTELKLRCPLVASDRYCRLAGLYIVYVLCFANL